MRAPISHATKDTNSAFTRSECVQHRPCGAPAISATLACLIILACLHEVATGGTALRTRSGTYLPIYRVTSPVPIENPTLVKDVDEVIR